MPAARLGSLRELFGAILIGIAAGSVALPSGLISKLEICLGLLIIPIIWWHLCEPNRWLYSFCVVAWLSPPLPQKLGDSGPHPALVFAALGLVVGLLRISEWNFRADPLTVSISALFCIMLGSSALSALYSGPVAAVGSAVRVLLFGIAVYCFFYVRSGPFRGSGQDALSFTRVLFWAAIASATFAMVDFYYHFPAPAGFGAQYVWLETGTFRRAQGFFYEASTLGNLCVFILDMVAAAVFSPRHMAPAINRWVLLCGVPPLLGALVLSYSRASLVSLLLGVSTLVWITWRQSSSRRWFLSLGVICVAASVFLIKVFPTFANAYWIRLLNTVEFFWESPDAILSGRLHTWQILGNYLIVHPWDALFGIGYKSLPYTSVVGTPIIADNTYLSALVEIGVAGLACLLTFNFAVLKTSYKASRAADPNRAFYGRWMFCFWVGQIVQMFSADLLTYWRVLPAYFCVIALASRSNDQLR